MLLETGGLPVASLVSWMCCGVFVGLMLSRIRAPNDAPVVKTNKNNVSNMITVEGYLIHFHQPPLARGRLQSLGSALSPGASGASGSC